MTSTTKRQPEVRAAGGAHIATFDQDGTLWASLAANPHTAGAKLGRSDDT